MNKHIITATLTKDPVMNTTPSGKHVAEMDVAVNERVTKNREKKEVTTYFRVEVWDAMADNVMKYLTKASKILAEGREEVSTYTASDGTTRISRKIIASNIEFIGGKPSSEQRPQAPQTPQPAQPEPVDETGDDFPW